MSLFFFDIWVALSVPQCGLICNPSTPTQSKHTFSVSHFFWKIASKSRYVGSTLGVIVLPNCTVEWNNAQKNASKKVPFSEKIVPIQAWLAPRAARLACAFSEQETTVWAGNNSSCSCLSPFLSPVLFWRNFAEKNWVIAEVVVAVSVVCFPFPKVHDLTRPGQGPANLWCQHSGDTYLTPLYYPIDVGGLMQNCWAQLFDS